MKNSESNSQEPGNQESIKISDDKNSPISMAMKSGNRPHISDQRLEANRWQLRRNLRAESSKQNSSLGRLSFIVATNKFQLAGMFLTFTLGFLLASNKNIAVQTLNDEDSQIVQHVDSEEQAENIVDPRDQIIDFSINKDKKSGSQFRVKYTTLRQTKLDTNFEDENTVSLLATAMKTDLNDATRLELVEILKQHLENSQVRESLSYSLLNDPNPGVRMIVAESLAKLSDNQSIRKILRQALIKDTNQGVRVSVFEGLLEHLDDQTIQLFRNRSSKDSNYYIRSKSQNIINEITQQNKLRKNSI